MNFSSGEKRDAVVIAIAYSMLVVDSKEEGDYIDEETSITLNEIRNDLLEVLKHYAACRKYIDAKLNSIETRFKANKCFFSITAPQFACELLYLRFSPNERGGVKLSKIISDFFDKNKEKISSVCDKAFDGKYNDQAEDSMNLAYKYLSEL